MCSSMKTSEIGHSVGYRDSLISAISLKENRVVLQGIPNEEKGG